MVYTLLMSTKTFWILATGLWACMITARVTLEGAPRAVVFAGIVMVWIGLIVERWRNLRRPRAGRR